MPLTNRSFQSRLGLVSRKHRHMLPAIDRIQGCRYSEGEPRGASASCFQLMSPKTSRFRVIRVRDKASRAAPLPEVFYYADFVAVNVVLAIQRVTPIG